MQHSIFFSVISFHLIHPWKELIHYFLSLVLFLEQEFFLFYNLIQLKNFQFLWLNITKQIAAKMLLKYMYMYIDLYLGLTFKWLKYCLYNINFKTKQLFNLKNSRILKDWLKCMNAKYLNIYIHMFIMCNN